MYVKLFNQILDSSLADNRRLRHFFTDLLLCSDAEGNVLMTKNAIATRIRSELSEVEWGLAELMRPDPASLTQAHDGRRIIPLEGHGYGWKIVNYTRYRDIKSDRQRREETAERVRLWRERKKAEKADAAPEKPKRGRKKKVVPAAGAPLAGETDYVRRYENGEVDRDGVEIVKSQRRPEEAMVRTAERNVVSGAPGEPLVADRQMASAPRKGSLMKAKLLGIAAEQLGSEPRDFAGGG